MASDSALSIRLRADYLRSQFAKRHHARSAVMRQVAQLSDEQLVEMDRKHHEDAVRSKRPGGSK